MYGLETVVVTKRQEAQLEMGEFKMLRFSLGVTRMDRIRNEWIAQVGCFGDKVREVRLGLFGHMERRDSGLTGQRMLKMELPGRRKREKSQRRM